MTPEGNSQQLAGGCPEAALATCLDQTTTTTDHAQQRQQQHSKQDQQHQQQHDQLHLQLQPTTTSQSKRKEKARVAARARRSQEASIIMEMAGELHISPDKLRRIDKATIVKLAIDFLKAYEVLCRLNNNNSSQDSQALAAIISETNPRQAAAITTTTIPKATAIATTTPTTTTAEPAPKLSTSSIFAPKTKEDQHFLMVSERNGTASLIMIPDYELDEADDLTHLAPQAGDLSIMLEVEPLEGIVIEPDLFKAYSPPPMKRFAPNKQSPGQSPALSQYLASQHQNQNQCRAQHHHNHINHSNHNNHQNNYNYSQNHNHNHSSQQLQHQQLQYQHQFKPQVV